MPWRHLLSLILLAFHAMLVVLNYNGLLEPLMDSQGFLAAAWGWIHSPALWASSMALTWIETLSSLAPDPRIVATVVLVCLAVQDLAMGYLVGGVMDLFWDRWFGKEEVVKEEEEEMHRDLKIAARVLSRVEEAEKERARNDSPGKTAAPGTSS